MRFRRQILPPILGGLALASLIVRADPGDVAGSRDYPNFPRLPGFVITDYDEDNPAEFDFPVARPLPIDADHVETVPAKGHRYVIRYEGSEGRAPSLLQTQEYYEQLAAAAGFTAEKTGAVGDVTETFRRIKAGREVWIYLEPAVTFNVLTILESSEFSPLPATPHSLAVVPVAPASVAATASASTVSIALVPASIPHPVMDENALYAALNLDGRIVVPLNFLPGKDDLDGASQPEIDRIAVMMKLHPELFLRIEGHTDNSGDSDEDLRLSARRAFAVRALLMAQDIEKSRLDPVGVGGLQPIADNNTAEGRAKNRRIELVVRKKYPAFHSPAPNGKNYYPGGSASAN